LTRRRILEWGIGLGAIAGVGLVGRAVLLPPRPSAQLDPLPDLAVRLFDALDADEKAEAHVDYDHPLRQYHNRGVDTGGIWAFKLSREARSMLVDLVHAGLSPQGRQRLPSQFFLDWPGIHVTRLLICGDPRTPPYQILVSGPHLNLRLAGASREGVAFGGPQVYGDQRGNGKPGLPGNTYRYQLQRGQELFASLTPAERKTARREKAPVQTDIAVRGRAGRFDGIPVADLSAKSRRLARGLAAAILENYAEDDVAYAWDCIERNGGVDALFLADYDQDHQGGRRAGTGPSQIFRLEGPAAVFYFRGEPHLHAFLNVAMDGDEPLSVGDLVAVNPTALDSAGVKALFEEIMLEQAGADLAYYPAVGVAGRLRSGPIRTGDLYTLESWRDRVAVVEVEGANLAEPMRTALRSRGSALQLRNTYRIATVRYVADELADEALGTVESDETGAMLRDVVIAHLTEHGFPSHA
jgi:hypothetical protein